MSNIFTKFWPFKSFFTYVFKRVLGKYLKKEVNFDELNFSKSKWTFRNLELNTQIINENLKDSLYKVISCNIGVVKVVNPSLNFLTKKLDIQIQDSSSEDEKQKDHSTTKDEAQKQTEEFNILNNLVNKILSNLEVKLQNLVIRVLTNEISATSQDIPTFLLRFSQIQYKRDHESSFQVQNQASVPPTDLQIILDGKALEFSEISIFQLRHFNIHPDQLHKKNSNISRLKFPFEYPLLNDPSTILVIKPIISHKSIANNNNQGGLLPSAISIYFNFGKAKQDKNLLNQLQLSVKVPNIELIADFNQLKGILTFAQRIDDYVTLNKADALVLKGDNQWDNIEPMKNQRCEEDMIDLYGTMIKTNSTFKELEKMQSDIPQMKKVQSEKVKMNKQNKLGKKKPFFSKNKLLTSFLTKELSKQAKGDPQANTFYGQQMQAQNSNALDDQNELYNSLMFSSDMNRSFLQNAQTESNLSLSLNLAIHKVSVLFLCTEQSLQYQNSSLTSPEQVYDRIYDSIYHLIYESQAQMLHQSEDDLGYDCRKYPLKRNEHRVSSTYYDAEVRNLSVCFTFQKKETKAKKGNPFAPDEKAHKLDHMELSLQVSALQIDRYDFFDQSQCQSYGGVPVLLENYVNPNEMSSMNQYESFSQSSGVFQSAVEYYQLEQIEESKFMHVSKRQQSSTQAQGIPFTANASSNGGTGGGVDQSQIGPISEIIYQPGTFQNYVLTQLFKQNTYMHHFCRNQVFEAIQLTKIQDPQVALVKIIIEKEKKSIKIKGKGRIGNLRLNMGWNEIIVLMQIGKMVEKKDKKFLERQKMSKKQTIIERLDFEIEGLGVKIQNVLQQPNQLIGLMIEDQPVNRLITPECECSHQSKDKNKKPQSYEFFTLIEVTNPTLAIQGSNVTVSIKSIDILMSPQATLQQLPLLYFANVILTINTYDPKDPFSKPNQCQSIEPKEKYRVQRSKIIFEDKEIDNEKYNSDSSSDHEIIQDDEASSQQQKPLPPKVYIKITLQQATAYLDMKNIKHYMEYLISLERQIKVILILEDVIKSQQNLTEQKHKNQAVTNKYLAHPLHLQVIIDDIQITIVDTDTQLSNTANNNSNSIFQAQKPIQLLKLRLRRIYFWLSLQSEFDTFQDKYDIKTISKESQVFIKFDLKLDDGFLLDYTQPLANYHPSYLKQTIIVQQNAQNFITQDQIPFEEELQKSAPFMILYRQQGLGEKYDEPRLVSMNCEIAIEQVTEFKKVISLNKIAQCLMEAPENNRVLQVFSDLDALKKNPMKLEMDITIQGLIGRLTFEQEAFKKFKAYKAKVKPIIKEQRIAPVVNKEFQEIIGGMVMRDMVSVYFNFQDITIDYTPLIQAKLYPQIFKDLEKDKEVASNSDSVLFKTPLRCIVQLNDSQLIMKENYQNQVKSPDGSTKMNYVKEKLFIAKVFSISILNNMGSQYKDFLNPTLLLDFQYSLDSLSGYSLLDQMGFSQIFAIDHLELQNQQDCIYEQILMDGSVGGVDGEVHNNGDKNDLFQTSYGLETHVQYHKAIIQLVVDKDALVKCQVKDQVAEEKLTIVVNKILLFLAKDSLETIKNINKIIQISMNKNKRKQNPKTSKAKEKQRLEELEELKEQYEQSEFQRVIEDFLFMEMEKSQSHQQEMNQSLLIQTNEDEEEKEESKWDYVENTSSPVIGINENNQDYLSGINEGGIHVSNLETFDMKAVLIENYIPIFNEEDINEGRHRNCHVLKQDDDWKMKKKFYIEINTIDIKLYQGMDFDFDQNQSQVNQQARSLASSQMHSKVRSSQISKSRKNQNLFEVDEEYMNIGEEAKTLFEDIKQSSLIAKQNDIKKNIGQFKRKRNSEKSKSHYFQLLIHNPIFSRHQLAITGGESSNQIEDRTKLCFSVKELSLKETISRQGTQRFLLHLPDQYKYDNQICITIINDEFLSMIETEAKVQIQTFKFTLNQALFTFFQTFFDLNFGSHKKSTKSSSTNLSSQQRSNVESSLQESLKKVSKPTFIRGLKIDSFRAILSYTSKNLNILDLTGGNMIEFLNIFNINDLKIKVKKYEIKQRLKTEDVLKHLLEFYKQDLVGNQKVSFIKAIGPIRSVANIVGAFYGVVNKPYQSYVQDKSVVVGFSTGLYNLYAVFSTETVGLSQKVIQGIAGGQKKMKGKRL